MSTSTNRHAPKELQEIIPQPIKIPPTVFTRHKWLKGVYFRTLLAVCANIHMSNGEKTWFIAESNLLPINGWPTLVLPCKFRPLLWIHQCLHRCYHYPYSTKRSIVHWTVFLDTHAVASRFIYVVSYSTVVFVPTHRYRCRSPLSIMVHGPSQLQAAYFLQCHFAMRGTLLSRHHANSTQTP